MSYLRNLVLAKIRSFPTQAEAAHFFDVSSALIKQWEAGSKPVSLSAVERVFDPENVPGNAAFEAKLWEGRQVYLALPWYKDVRPKTSFALLSLMDRTRIATALDYGDAFVAHSRNKLTDAFLRTKLEWMLMVDSDMIPPFGNPGLYNSFTGFNLPDLIAGRNTIDRLLSHGKTFVGAFYRGRWVHGKWMFAEGNDAALVKTINSRVLDECRPTRWVGSGCLLIHRTVFLDIEKKFPHLARGADGRGGQCWTSSEHDLHAAISKAMEMDDPAEMKRVLEHALNVARIHSGLGMGEDVQLCVRATQAGHQPHVDFGCICGHTGDFDYGFDRTLTK